MKNLFKRTVLVLVVVFGLITLNSCTDSNEKLLDSNEQLINKDEVGDEGDEQQEGGN
ncbi:hypothetical protein [Tenacibaculum sp. SZ-18]|uniref:hypothetical protein n=1 Tax=Tenacibaculum sp. SZ-18 TaxID=754423 RepID=UPI0012FDF381|nr:hypothetical protein [Tenacibaculum sp. SZ-18]